MESHNGAASLRASCVALKMKSTGGKLGKVGEARSYIKFDFLGSCFLGSSWEYYYIRQENEMFGNCREVGTFEDRDNVTNTS